MTQFPQKPNFIIDDATKIATLQEDHFTSVKLWFGMKLNVLIKAGFKFDGASVPIDKLNKSKAAKWACKIIAKHYPGKDYKETLAYLIGEPYEMPRLLAAIVHDALYGLKWKCRWLCDNVYRRILCKAKYDEVRLVIEYSGIRLFGGDNWDAVTKKEKIETKKLVEAKLTYA